MIVDDVIAVRFLSKPYREIENLRVGSPLIAPWLKSKLIHCYAESGKLIFTLPEKFNVLTHLNPDVLAALEPVEQILRSELLKLDAHFSGHVNRFSTPLDTKEILGIYKIVHRKLSFASFTK